MALAFTMPSSTVYSGWWWISVLSNDPGRCAVGLSVSVGCACGAHSHRVPPLVRVGVGRGPVRAPPSPQKRSAAGWYEKMATRRGKAAASGTPSALAASPCSTATPTTHTTAGSKSRPVDTNEEPRTAGAAHHESTRMPAPPQRNEDVALRHDDRRVRARHAVPDGSTSESSAEEVVTAGGTSAQPPSGALAVAAEHTDGPTMTSNDACTAAGRALMP